MERSCPSMLDLIDSIDDKNARIDMWLSNLAMVQNVIEREAFVYKRLARCNDVLGLTLAGLKDCQYEAQELIDQALKLAREQ